MTRADDNAGPEQNVLLDGSPSAMRIDLHLHSCASGAATNWWVKGLGLGLETQESYTDPEAAYDMARAAGMDFVTLTDHETIDGAMTLAARPRFLVGVEVGTIFPEDGTHADVLVYGVDAAAHQELQARRANVYHLVDYLREANLVHVLAHPIFEVGAPLDRAGIEKRLALFGRWECINGSRPFEQNRLTQQIAGGVDASDLRQMACRHGLPVPPHRRIAGTGGSDDHGGIYPGKTWTEIPRVISVSDLLAALAAGEMRPGGADGSVEKMASTGFRIIAGAASAANAPEPPSTSPETDAASRPPIARLLPGRSGDAEKILEYLPLFLALDSSQIRDLLAARYERQVSQALRSGDGSPVLGLLSSLGSFVDAHLYIAPYLGIHGYFGRERHKTRVLRQHLFPDQAQPVKVGLFVDNLDEIHGVATMYQQVKQLPTDPGSDRLCLVRCGEGRSSEAATLRPIAEVQMPFYDGHKLLVPSILEVLDHIASESYDVLHVATPGPLGLAAMVAGIMLGLPIVGAFHTEFGSYAKVLSGDAVVAELVEVLVREFYERCSIVVVPSQSTARSLEARGYRTGRIEVLKNGVDTMLYRPSRRDEKLRTSLGGGRTLLLYVGRVSQEKGLEQLADGYLELRRQRDHVHLVIVGDGPYRAELQAKLGDAATFTGFLRGEELARAYASCDIFVFPSTTDTLGRAVVEAQASGLPAIVFNVGGPQESVRDQVSGFVVEVNDDTRFLDCIACLADDPKRRRRMGEAARANAATLSWQNVRDSLVQLYREVDLAAASSPVDVRFV